MLVHALRMPGIGRRLGGPHPHQTGWFKRALPPGRLPPPPCADTLQDARFVSSQFVQGEPHVRFYAGAPLVRPPRNRCMVVPRPPSHAWRPAWMRLGSAARGACLFLMPRGPQAGPAARRATRLPPALPAWQVSSDGHVMGSLGVMDIKPRIFPAGERHRCRRCPRLLSSAALLAPLPELRQALPAGSAVLRASCFADLPPTGCSPAPAPMLCNSRCFEVLPVPRLLQARSTSFATLRSWWCGRWNATR